MDAHEEILRQRWPWLIGWFTWYCKRYLRKHFQGVRLSVCGPVPTDLPGPLIIVLNHPSWWDPLFGTILSEHFSGFAHFIPIEDEALRVYGVFKKLGFFAVRPGTAEGGRAFLRTTLALLSQPNAALWITAQGRFADVRVRPAGLRSGVAHLLQRLEHGTVVPLALEYPFWDQPKPEALARFGEPIPIVAGRGAREWLTLVESALIATQDVLAEESLSRDASRFVSLVESRKEIRGAYGFWKKLRSLLRRGKPLEPNKEGVA